MLLVLNAALTRKVLCQLLLKIWPFTPAENAWAFYQTNSHTFAIERTSEAPLTVTMPTTGCCLMALSHPREYNLGSCTAKCLNFTRQETASLALAHNTAQGAVQGPSVQDTVMINCFSAVDYQCCQRLGETANSISLIYTLRHQKRTVYKCTEIAQGNLEPGLKE